MIFAESEWLVVSGESVQYAIYRGLGDFTVWSRTRDRCAREGGTFRTLEDAMRALPAEAKLTEVERWADVPPCWEVPGM